MSMPGKIAYEAYRNHTGGKSLATGHPITEWDELPEEIRDAWNAAAGAVVGYAALVVTVATDIGLEDCHVYLCNSEDAAVKFAVDALVASGELLCEGGAWLSHDRQDRWESAEAALEAWQETCLGASEYLHVYDVTRVFIPGSF